MSPARKTSTRLENLWPLGFIAVPLGYGLWLASGSLVGALLWLGLVACVALALHWLRRRGPGDVKSAVVTLIAAVALLDGDLPGGRRMDIGGTPGRGCLLPDPIAAAGRARDVAGGPAVAAARHHSAKGASGGREERRDGLVAAEIPDHRDRRSPSAARRRPEPGKTAAAACAPTRRRRRRSRAARAARASRRPASHPCCVGQTQRPLEIAWAEQAREPTRTQRAAGEISE